MTTVPLVVLLLGVTLPHALRLSRADPSTAALLWVANLGLRALAGMFVATYVILFLPGTEFFSALTRWCWHAVLPLIATHLGFNGHRIGDAAAALPTIALGLSVFWVGAGVVRVARSVRRLITRAALGRGPRDTLIVGGAEVVVAAAGLAKPRVLVSAGALTQLDDEELAAGLEHERGHIARRHRWILVYAELCRALGVFVPGTRAAIRELNLHLERDADRWALARRHDRLALASAIVKAATTAGRPSVAFAALGGPSDHLTQRLEDLVSESPAPAKSHRRSLTALAVVTCVLTAVFAAAVPNTVAAGLDRPSLTHANRCPE